LGNEAELRQFSSLSLLDGRVFDTFIRFCRHPFDVVDLVGLGDEYLSTDTQLPPNKDDNLLPIAMTVFFNVYFICISKPT
jgi:hypothetical protein